MQSITEKLEWWAQVMVRRLGEDGARELVEKIIQQEQQAKVEIAEPEIRTFDIWAEGYRATGDFSRANHLGKSKGRTLKEACDNLAATNPVFNMYYDAERLTYWGCKIFDNEAEARLTFG